MCVVFICHISSQFSGVNFQFFSYLIGSPTLLKYFPQFSANFSQFSANFSQFSLRLLYFQWFSLQFFAVFLTFLQFFSEFPNLLSIYRDSCRYFLIFSHIFNSFAHKNIQHSHDKTKLKAFRCSLLQILINQMDDSVLPLSQCAWCTIFRVCVFLVIVSSCNLKQKHFHRTNLQPSNLQTFSRSSYLSDFHIFQHKKLSTVTLINPWYSGILCDSVGRSTKIICVLDIFQ